jgi:hypothetical protein
MQQFFLAVLSLIIMNVSNRGDYKVFNLSNSLGKEELVNLSEIAKEVKFIKLEYTTESILSYIKGVIFFKNNILVYDVKNNLCLFDLNGKFIRHIGKIGRGPGEYSNILCIDADILNEIIYVLDNNSPYLLSYYLNGDFRPTNIPCRNKISFSCYNNQFFFHTPSNLVLLDKGYGEDNNYQLSVVNSNGIQIGGFHNLNKKNSKSSSFIENATFSKYFDGELIYHVEGENKVFSLQGDSLRIKYFFDFGKYDNSNSSGQINSINSQQNEDFMIHEILSYDKYIFLYYQYHKKTGLMFFDGSKFRTVDTNYGGTITDDIDGTGKLFYQLFFQDKIMIEPINVTKLLNNKNDQAQSSRIKALKTSLNEYDNPVLRIVTLK